jgi:hypothetical protein
MQTPECHHAIERLSIYITDPQAASMNIDMVLSHMRNCSSCRASIGYLVRAAEMNQDDRFDCEKCQDRLPEYADAVETGRAITLEWRSVALHLVLCPHCAATYADITSMLDLAIGRRGVEPPTYPAPNLAFLNVTTRSPARIERKAWLLDQLGRLVVTLSDELVRAAQPLTPAVAGLKSTDRSGPMLLLSVPDAAVDLHVTITAEQVRNNPARYSAGVMVVIPSRGGWPNLEGSEVALRQGEQIIETQITDAFGKAIFAEFTKEELGQLAFEIKPAAGSSAEPSY